MDLLVGDASKVDKLLGWKPKVQFEELVEIMVKADWDRLSINGRV
ncbi:MAG TPA: GDP-mannose 4,6-dehydratase [Tenuifilaceae bacterium]|nr:GDP-mannose 4,6-dehydratase [Tenuifilaceae bacterium]